MPHAAGLYYEEHGNGPSLILSAGLGGSGSYWAPNLAALATHHRVIVYDHRGTGRSDRAVPDIMGVNDMANDVIALMDHLKLDRASLLGHALGGLIGLSLAQTVPDRLDKLIVVNGWSMIDAVTARCFEARLHVLASGGSEAYLRAQPIFLFPATWMSENNVRLNDDLAEQVEHFQGEETLKLRIEALRSFDATQWVGSLTTPTLALAARDDMLVPYTASQLYASTNDAITVSLMEWGGHACNVTDPATFDRIVLDFLRS